MDGRKSFDPPIRRTANLCETQSIKHMLCSVTNIGEQKYLQSNCGRAKTKWRLLLIKNCAIILTLWLL